MRSLASSFRVRCTGAQGFMLVFPRSGRRAPERGKRSFRRYAGKSFERECLQQANGTTEAHQPKSQATFLTAHVFFRMDENYFIMLSREG